MVATFPIARRSTNFPCSVVPDRNARPLALMRSSRSRLSLIRAAVAETNQREEDGRGQFESRIGGDALREIARHFHVAPQNPDDSFAAEIAQHEPQLQRSETPAQRQAVFGEIDGAVLLGGLKIGRRFFERQHAPHDVLPASIENAQIDGREEPLVRIHHQRIGLRRAVEDVAVFFEQRGRSGIGGVDVKPEIVAPGDLADLRNGIDAGGGSGPGRRDHAERLSGRREVFCDHRRPAHPGACGIRHRKERGGCYRGRCRRPERRGRWRNARARKHRGPAEDVRRCGARLERRARARPGSRAGCRWKRCRE